MEEILPARRLFCRLREYSLDFFTGLLYNKNIHRQTPDARRAQAEQENGGFSHARFCKGYAEQGP
ncbi:MAG TPA: hypothetical protein IAB37_09065 [Candidatus Faecivivens stercoravium]|uniref:Uncharacterized protein n=1 Tax=Candidatus Faecivivens stercoravium TaxID=2840803 RepID=A0A9D1DYW9_9FIRM|nr:hypothetical protein [Candidatus Faecivivens stercoravium]